MKEYICKIASVDEVITKWNYEIKKQSFQTKIEMAVFCCFASNFNIVISIVIIDSGIFWEFCQILF